MRGKEYRARTRVLCWVLFAAYLAVLIYFLFFADMLGRTDTAQRYDYNLALFREIMRFWTYRDQVGHGYAFLNLAGNVLVFLPFGFLLPIMIKKCRGFFRVVLAGLALSFVVECVQLVTRTGCFDVDDLLLNTIGAALGFAVFAIVQACRGQRSKEKSGKKREKR